MIFGRCLSKRSFLSTISDITSFVLIGACFRRSDIKVLILFSNRDWAFVNLASDLEITGTWRGRARTRIDRGDEM